MSTGERIRARRKELKLTMQDITNLTGVKSGSLSEIENDKYLPSVQTLIPLSRALSCSIDWILTGSVLPLESRKNEDENGGEVPEAESDLLAMYRILDERDKNDIFEFVNIKYKRSTGEGESLYSTYFDTKNMGRSEPDKDNNAVSGIA